MRKRLLALLLLLAVGATASAEMPKHEHQLVEDLEFMVVEYVNMGDSHDACYQKRLSCAECGEETYLPPEWVTVEGHTLYLSDTFHKDDKHFYIFTCTKCGHETLRAIGCSGPPCSAIYGSYADFPFILHPDENGRYMMPTPIYDEQPSATFEVLPK